MDMKKEKYTMDELLDIMHMLCGPGGCAWDGEQTHGSIRRNMIEEAYEACEAIDNDDKALLCEELGDVLLQVVFHAEIERKQSGFTFEDVVDGVCRKLIVRHPHIFGDEKLNASSAQEMLDAWEEIKRRTKNNKTGAETLDAVARSLPALMRAEKLITRARRSGFEFPVPEEELSRDIPVGEELFLAVARAKKLGLEPEDELNRYSEEFISRFRAAEELCGGFEGKDRAVILDAWEKAEKR